MFNKTVIIGRVGAQPTLKATKTGNSMCSFNVAVGLGWGENKVTNWYSVTVFGKQAKACSEVLTKGSLVCVSGTLQLREYQWKDGQTKSSLDLTADAVSFLETKSRNRNLGESQAQSQNQPQADGDFDCAAEYPF